MAKAIRTRHERRAARDESADAAGGLLHRQIRPDPNNPRKTFDDDGLAELQASIVRDGLVEPLAVRPIPHTFEDGLPAYMLIAGERRWQAIGRAIAADEWDAEHPVEVTIKDVDEPTARRLALVENLQRRDLKPLEEARALQALIDLTGVSAAQVGRDLGFTERWAQQRLSLLKLPGEMQGRLEAGDLTIEDARESASLLPKLPEIKQIELQKGKITASQAKAWLATRPTAVELTDEEELVFLEAAHLIARKGKSGWTEAPCDYRWQDKITAILVNEKKLLAFGRDWNSSGQTTVRLAYPGQQTLEALIGTDWSLDKAKILPLMRRAQTKALGNPLRGDDMSAVSRQVDELEKAKRYLTGWLNAPFEVSPEFRAEAERRAQQIQADAQKQEQAAKEREERAARRSAAAPLAMKFARAIDAVPMGALADVIANLDAKLPWRWLVQGGRGMLVDAEGREIQLNRWNAPDGLLPLVMALVNAAGGHPAFFSDEVADQVDLEEAIDTSAEDEDLELTPALRRLAGGGEAVAAEG